MINRAMRSWWDGEPIENDRGAAIVFLNHTRQHWTARAAHSSLYYIRDNHRWLIGTALGLAGLAIAILKTK
jgi:hypothetical protein